MLKNVFKTAAIPTKKKTAKHVDDYYISLMKFIEYVYINNHIKGYIQKSGHSAKEVLDKGNESSARYITAEFFVFWGT